MIFPGGALDEDGYIVIRDVVDRERLSELAADLMSEYERFSVSSEMFEGGGTLSGHLNCFPGEQSRFVWDEISKAGIPDLVRAVRPDIADSVRATLNFNLPGKEFPTIGALAPEMPEGHIKFFPLDLQKRTAEFKETFEAVLRGVRFAPAGKGP